MLAYAVSNGEGTLIDFGITDLEGVLETIEASYGLLASECTYIIAPADEFPGMGE